MTIKQQGGVFGRNPTFNDVTVEGTLSGTTGVFSGDLTVDTNTLFVDTANNRVGLGTATPDTRVEISDTFGTTTSAVKIANLSSVASGNQGMIDFEFGNSFSGLHVDVRAGARKANAGNHDSSFVIQTSTGGGDARDVVEVTKDGNIVLSLSGAGIDFSATAGTGTSELFDDYEEGTWTPTFTYVSAGTLSVSYSSQTGFYTKIGDTVYIRMDLRFSSFTKGTASGTPLIAGLPFVAKNDSGFGRAVINSILYNWTFTSQPVAQVNSSGGSFIGLSRMVSNSTTADLDDPAGNSIIWISGCYHV
jgi:hypothetical protein